MDNDIKMVEFFVDTSERCGRWQAFILDMIKLRICDKFRNHHISPWK
jgi:hypothetical protein